MLLTLRCFFGGSKKREEEDVFFRDLKSGGKEAAKERNRPLVCDTQGHPARQGGDPQTPKGTPRGVRRRELGSFRGPNRLGS